jgi:hypothetical protein
LLRIVQSRCTPLRRGRTSWSAKHRAELAKLQAVQAHCSYRASLSSRSLAASRFLHHHKQSTPHA